MAQLNTSFKCKICDESLKFPNGIDIVDFTVLFLQFYKTHDKCEKLALKFKKDQESKSELESKSSEETKIVSNEIQLQTEVEQKEEA